MDSNEKIQYTEDQAVSIVISRCEEAAWNLYEDVTGEHSNYFKCVIDIGYDYYEWNKDRLRKIFTSGKKAQKKLDEEIDEIEMEIVDGYRDDYYREFRQCVFRKMERWGDNDALIESGVIDEDLFEDIVANWFSEMVYLEVTPDLSDGEIDINIECDITDMNVDFSTCVAGPHYAADDVEINPDWFWVWLALQQGYTIEQVQDAVDGHNFHDSKFLKSLYSEIANMTTSMNAFTFLVRMPIGEAAKLATFVSGAHSVPDYARYDGESRNDCGTITLDKTSVCGFLDRWNGAGSMFEISLEWDVELPVKYISSVMPDDAVKIYGAREIYGCDFWEDTVTKMDLKKGWGNNGEQ